MKFREKSRLNYLKNREQRLIDNKENKLLRRYGITSKDYENLLLKQNNKCAICGKTKMNNSNRRLAVDHNHKTGKVRGLLCGNCNAFLGMVESKGVTLKQVEEYLSRE